MKVILHEELVGTRLGFKTVEQMEQDIVNLQKSVKRAKRADAGKKRAKYDKTLPSRYRSYIQRANNKQIVFSLTVDEFNTIIESDCTYCGTGGCDGVDRIDSKGGYTKDNVVPCCFKCNMMKYTHTNDVFIKHVLRIADYIRSK